METPRTHRDLITALGGPSDLARQLDIYRGVPTTVHWRTRGIPARYWHRVCELAAKAGIQITGHDLERMPVSAVGESAPSGAEAA